MPLDPNDRQIFGKLMRKNFFNWITSKLIVGTSLTSKTNKQTKETIQKKQKKRYNKSIVHYTITFDLRHQVREDPSFPFFIALIAITLHILFAVKTNNLFKKTSPTKYIYNRQNLPSLELSKIFPSASLPNLKSRSLFKLQNILLGKWGCLEIADVLNM